MQSAVRITKPQAQKLVELLDDPSATALALYVENVENVANGVVLAASVDPPHDDVSRRHLSRSGLVRRHSFIAPDGVLWTP